MTLSHLVEGLASRGHAVEVIRPRQGRAELAAGHGLVAEHLFPSLPIPGYPWLRFGLPAKARLVLLWGDTRPDLVHIATEGPLGWSALQAARALALPVTSSFHTNFHRYSSHYGFRFLTRPALAYLRAFHNRTLATFSPTRSLNEELERDGLKNLRLLSRGVNTRISSPRHRSERLRAEWGAGPGQLVVVHVSRMAPEKNYPLLLKAYEAIGAARPDARFIVVGDGPVRRKLKRRHPNIKFTGFLSRDELAAHYASADLFLYASLTETFGNVVLEAMASGLPVLAFDYAAAAQFIRHRQNGWLVPFADQTGFMANAVRLACDAGLRCPLGQAARQTAEGIAWDTVIDDLEQEFMILAATPMVSPRPVFPARALP